MRSTSRALFVLALLVGACGGAGPAGTQGANPTTVAGQPTTAVQPTATQAGQPVPPAGGATVTVTLTGGATPGTYAGTGNPNCTLGLVGQGGWGVQFSTSAAGAGQLSSLQVVSNAPGHENDENTMFKGYKVVISATIGSLLNGTSYNVQVKTDPSVGDIYRGAGGTGTVDVTDAGTTAVIHAVGTTADGAGIDATVNCPTVTRQ